MILPERFWAKVRENPATGCWEWAAAIARNGYGQFAHEGRTRSAHRLAWLSLRGEIPEGMQLDHLCRVRHCVNPDHLDVVTARVNRERGNATHVRRNGPAVSPDHCIQGHPLAAPNLHTRARQRECRACYILRRRSTTKRAPSRGRLDLDALLAQAEAALAA